MSKLAPSAAASDPTATTPAQERLNALYAAGASQCDPVGFHFLQSLIARTATQSGAIRRRLDSRIATELETLARRLAGVRTTTTKSPNTMIRQAARPSLGNLIGLLNHNPPPRPGTASADPNRARIASELKSVGRFRATWSALRAEKQLAQAFDQAPDNAGPLNSHHLVLRSLDAMREISPGYVTHFMNHIDALLCLEAAEIAGSVAGKKTKRNRTGRRTAEKT